jgi:hypothetical protein
MNKMTLGGYTVWNNPEKFTIPKKYRNTASKSTYSGVMFFSYGLFTDGQEVVLEWDWCPIATFDALQILLEQDTAHNWNPQTGTSYVVQILKLDGKYVLNSLLDAPWRRDVKLTLLIRSESV